MSIADQLNSSELLRVLQDDPKFQAVMAELARHRPGVPSFQPQRTTDENKVLIEKIKFATAQQKGFDLLYAVLTGQTPTT